MTEVRLNTLRSTIETRTDEQIGDVVLTETETKHLAHLVQRPPASATTSIVTPNEVRDSQLRLAELLRDRDYVGLRAEVEKRTASSVYIDTLAKRDALKSEVDSLALQADKARSQTKLVDRKVATQAAFTQRKLTADFREKYEELRFISAQLNEYRLVTAQFAFASATLQEIFEREDGSFLEYTSDRLNNLRSAGNFESNSPEWHALREGGIGGSDVGAIMRADKEWASANYSRMLNTKLGIEEPGVADSWDLRSGIGRGNAWEEYIRYTVALKHPELQIAFCKTSWKSTVKSYRHANFDGLILNAFGIPEGVLEIKTGSDISKWGPESEGIFAVPAGYRKQVIWYAFNGGLKYGKLVAVIDDHLYREYDFTMDDPLIKAEIDEMLESTDTFWESLTEKKERLAAGEEIKKRQRRGMKVTNDYDAIAEVYAGYADLPFEQAKDEVVNSIEALKSSKGRMLTDFEFQRAAVAVFAKHDPSKRNRPFIGVDLETTTTSPRTGRIIETGIARLDADGTVEPVYSELHDVPKNALVGVGLGEFDIHRITASMIAGAERFDSEEAQKAILELLKSGTMVAHNAGFEDRFLTAHLNGYLEAKLAGEISILDTRRLASFLMPRSDDSSLQSFAEDNGVPYEGAHAATADTVMMLLALSRLQRSLYKNGGFRVKRITDAGRIRAHREALEAAKTR